MKLRKWNMVLWAVLSTAFLGLLVSFLSQLLASWTTPAYLSLPSPRISSRKFEWKIQTPHPFDLRYPYSYPFLINHPDKCEGPRGAPFLLMLVMTRPQDVGVRQAIRQTWGNETLVPSVVVRRLFVLGLPPPLFDKELQALLEEEDREHGDLLQVGFLDTYRNLTLKVLMGLEWMAQHCPSAKYVLKVDSDVFLNPRFLLHQVLWPNGPSPPDFITGHINRNTNPVRRLHTKWYMPPELYSQSKYPDYCVGPGYVLSGSLALRILTTAQHVKAIYLEDVFVGLCLRLLGVKPTPAPPNTFLMFRRKYNHCAFQRLVLVHQFQHQELLKIWPDFLTSNAACPTV
ncbi:beta-1,3-galactosyltransferase 2-like [Monodelphis domestica]|uniref:beta-1,3-galactosyltransferase 2-like n=1 Tax=Monodelphis domestica TaxID=13616 RepID=UPI0000F2C95D|nr:beta-1,3-galactosyltransferase 2-like [Monodelphis domestica]